MTFHATECCYPPVQDRPVDVQTQEPPKGVVRHALRCPSCDSTEVRVTRSKKPVRYHKCQDCGWTFKSVDGKPTE
jgi:predicted RNA-binding Zn-ribbon protein involved in translation (DUF1610 family)